MTGAADMPRDLASLVVLRCGSVVATGEVFEPFRLVDADGVVVGPAAAFLRDLQTCGRSASTLRSYGMDLLRWFRFLWAIGIFWECHPLLVTWIHTSALRAHQQPPGQPNPHVDLAATGL